MSLIDTERLNALCLRLWMRCLRRQVDTASVASPHLSRADVQALRLYWALSQWVERLAQRVIEHPREARETLDYERIENYGDVLGLVDAGATLLEQERTQDPCLYVGYDATTTMLSGSNQVVAWTLGEAQRVLLWAVRRHKLDDTYRWLSDRLRLLDEALRIHSLREVMLSPVGHLRPGSAALRAASKSTVLLYRLALEAFLALEDIEGLKEDRLNMLFSQTLLSALEDWQRFELATAMATATAIAEATRVPVELELALGPRKPVARIGPFSIWWQFSQRSRPEHLLDESERMAKAMAESLGATQAAGRADVTVWHSHIDAPLAFLECKWFGSPDTLQGAVLDASTELVRYARDAHPGSIPSAEALLRRSVIVVASRNSTPERLDLSGSVNFTDFEGLESGALVLWAAHLVAAVN